MTSGVSQSTPPLVMVVGRGVPSEATPLLGCFELDQVRALKAAGARVVYAALDARSVRRRRPWGFSSRVDESGVPIESLSVPLGQLPVRMNHWLMGQAWKALLRRVVRRYGLPDVVHAHFTQWGAVVVDHTSSGPLVVVTEHWSRLTSGTISPRVRWMAERAYRADRLIAVSSTLADVMRDQFGVSCSVVGNVIDLETFAATPRVPHEGVRIVSTGNLIARKRMDLLIDGFAVLAARRADVQLTIVGEGPDEAALRAQIARLGLDDRVELRGRASRPELDAIYRGSDIFAMVSSHETFGVVYAEALAAGLPVVAPRIPGPDEFLDETVCEWCEATPEGVAAALERVIERLPGFDPLRLRAHVAERYSGPAVASQLLDVYGSSATLVE